MEEYIPKCDAYIELMKCKDFDTDKLYHGNHYLKIACDVIRSIPPADVVERKKGKWEIVDEEEPRRYGCSVCKRMSFHPYYFCPNCGAEMVGET